MAIWVLGLMHCMSVDEAGTYLSFEIISCWKYELDRSGFPWVMSISSITWTGGGRPGQKLVTYCITVTDADVYLLMNLPVLGL